MATEWRLAEALNTYKSELNARWPHRDRRSDGGIGDAEHATRNSDHNPWLKSAGVGVVRAWDTDKDLTGAGTDALPPEVNVEANWLAEHLRSLGKAGDPRLSGGGYVIWNQRIAGEVGAWAWRPYEGENAHKHHVHLSVSRNATGFDSTAPWGLWPLPATPIQEDDDMTPEQDARMKSIEYQLTNKWPQLGGRTLVDAVALVLGETRGEFDFGNGQPKTTLIGAIGRLTRKLGA